MRNGTFAYVTVGGLNECKVFRTDDFAQSRRSLSAIFRMASGLRATARASMSGSRMATRCRDRHADQHGHRHHPDRPGAAGHRLCAERRAARRRHPRPAAVGVAGQTAHLDARAPRTRQAGAAPTSVSLFDQGLIQVLEAAVTGLAPKTAYVLALAAGRMARIAAAAGRFHDQSRGLGHRQRGRPDPPDRAEQCLDRAALSRDRRGHAGATGNRRPASSDAVKQEGTCRRARAAGTTMPGPTRARL